MSAVNNLNELREQEYQQRLEVNRLRREVYQQVDLAAPQNLMDELQEAEKALSEIERKLAGMQAEDPKDRGLLLETKKETGLLGSESTGIDAQVYLRMARVPTSICHLLSPEQTPLVTCRVYNVNDKHGIRRLRVTSFIEGYSAKAVDTVELEPFNDQQFDQLPTLFPDRIEHVTELTRATLNLLIEDMDKRKLELHKTWPIWLLARTTAPLAVKDPKSNEWRDLTLYFGAFVTPNAPSVIRFLRVVAQYHGKALKGYQGSREEVEPQVRAIFNALKKEANITYVDSSEIAFGEVKGFAQQRVRLPRESLADKMANCIDGTVLFASLLEGISMSPAIVVVPGHAFVAWETWKEQDEQGNIKWSNEWRYLETTMIGSHNFKQACNEAERLAQFYQSLVTSTGDSSYFRRWPLRELRSSHRITPME